MTDIVDIVDMTQPVDGRMARRQRNVDAVLDVVLEMFAEESLFPTIEQAASRSGLSLRSLYRYFADPGELLEASIKKSRARGVKLSRLHAIGRGPLAQRIDDFAAMRLGLFNAVGPVYRATVANAARHPLIRDELAKNRDEMRTQFELQFARELAERKPTDHDVVLCAGDLVTQLDSLDYLRRHRELSVAETHSVIVSTLHSLLG